MKSKLILRPLLFPSLVIIFIGIPLFAIVVNYPVDFFKLRGIDYFMIFLFLITLVWIITLKIKKDQENIINLALYLFFI